MRQNVMNASIQIVVRSDFANVLLQYKYFIKTEQFRFCITPTQSSPLSGGVGDMGQYADTIYDSD
jgi:hypothetical protein